MIFKRSSIGLGFSWIDGSSCKVGWNTWLPPTSTSQPLSCHNVWMLFKVQQQWTSTYIYIYYIICIYIILYIVNDGREPELGLNIHHTIAINQSEKNTYLWHPEDVKWFLRSQVNTGAWCRPCSSAPVPFNWCQVH